ncbi:MAG: hypothetical protein O7A09_03920 [Proteobacteria bacterium]|nr:hypothetical protein [Pseudomonadota bacterium]
MDPEDPRRRLAGAAAIRHALDAGDPLRLLLRRKGAAEAEVEAVLERAEERGVPVRVASPREMERFAGAGEPQDVLALLGPPPDADLETVLGARGALWLLAGTAYPGNAGFALRSAEVSGADGLVIDADFGHAARQKVLHASMRADRFMPVFFQSADEVLPRAEAHGRRILAIESSGTRAPWQVDLRPACVLVVGAEDDGIPEPILARAAEVIRIPMAGFIPSYNLQAAMAMVMAERLRQLAAD